MAILPCQRTVHWEWAASAICSRFLSSLHLLLQFGRTVALRLLWLLRLLRGHVFVVVYRGQERIDVVWGKPRGIREGHESGVLEGILQLLHGLHGGVEKRRRVVEECLLADTPFVAVLRVVLDARVVEASAVLLSRTVARVSVLHSVVVHLHGIAAEVARQRVLLLRDTAGCCLDAFLLLPAAAVLVLGVLDGLGCLERGRRCRRRRRDGVVCGVQHRLRGRRRPRRFGVAALPCRPGRLS